MSTKIRKNSAATATPSATGTNPAKKRRSSDNDKPIKKVKSSDGAVKKAGFQRSSKAPSVEGAARPNRSKSDSFKKRKPSGPSKEELAAKRLKAISEAQRDARHELVVKCNKIWNDLRSKDLDDEKQKSLSQELIKLLKGKILSFAQRPDTSRVIQTVFKLGNEASRKMILDELASNMSVLSKGKYSSFLVISLLRHGGEGERAKLAGELREHVRALGTHANGARVVNFCLSGSPADSTEENVITDAEKKRFYEKFYGLDLTLLSKIVKTSGDDKIDMGLAQYLPSDESKKSSSIQALKKLVLKIAEKGLLRFPFAQFLCWQLIMNANREDICDMIPSISEAALAMVGTWEGTQAVVRCMIAADAKDRKKIIKEWKTHIVDLCAHKFGWYLVCRALDSVDDTKFLEKSIIEELVADEAKVRGLLLQEDGFGRKVFLRVLAPESRLNHYFEDFEKTFLSDPAGLSTSKKDKDIRRRENLAKMLPKLLEVASYHSDELLQSARATDVVREVFYCLVENSSASESAETTADLSLIAEASKLSDAICEVAPTLLEDARAHATLKRIIRDETEAKSGTESSSFALKLAEKLQGKMFDFAKVNRSAFVLEALAANPHSKDLVRKELSSKKSKLPKDVKGSEALLKQLSA